MNCKPGDIAYLIKNLDVTHMGEVVTVVRRDTFVRVLTTHVEQGVTYWLLEEPIHCGGKFANGSTFSGVIVDISDGILRPIGNPGEHEVDETLISNPVRELVPA